MAIITPETGLVIRYDFLWKNEAQLGVEDGKKDRPCAIVLISSTRHDGSHEVYVCPITHSPPHADETGIEIPYNVTQHLALDHARMWIKTHELNRFIWEKDRIPFGVTPARKQQWSFGMLPHALGKQVFEQVRQNSKKNNLDIVQRTSG